MDLAAEPLDAALASATASVQARVEALEQYAERVQAADRAYRLHRHLTDHAADYQELVAVAAAGADTTRGRLERLAAEADEVNRRLRESVGAANARDSGQPLPSAQPRASVS